MEEDEAPAVSWLEQLLNETPIGTFRNVFLRVARRRLGEPTPEQEVSVRAIDDYDRLFEMAMFGIDRSKSWDELPTFPPAVVKVRTTFTA